MSSYYFDTDSGVIVDERADTLADAAAEIARLRDDRDRDREAIDHLLAIVANIPPRYVRARRSDGLLRSLAHIATIPMCGHLVSRIRGHLSGARL